MKDQFKVGYKFASKADWSKLCSRAVSCECWGLQTQTKVEWNCPYRIAIAALVLTELRQKHELDRPGIEAEA